MNKTEMKKYVTEKEKWKKRFKKTEKEKGRYVVLKLPIVGCDQEIVVLNGVFLFEVRLFSSTKNDYRELSFN